MSAGAGAMETALARIASGRPLTREEARGAMSALLAGEATPAQTGAFLMGLKVRGETEEEILGLVEGLRAGCAGIAPGREPLMDLCGTGGDGSGTFNISTAAALVVAGAGVAVAKHGNRAMSSRSGSADVLEALGVPVDLSPDRACSAVEEIGFAFLFAPLYHPAMRHVASARKEIRARTIFNFLGPLASPAGVKRQLIGVCEDRARGMLARVLAGLGSEEVWVVHGHGGLDEVSISGPTAVTRAGRGGCQEYVIEPSHAGIAPGSLAALRGGGPAENAAIIEKVLAGERGPARDAVILNAAAALAVAGAARDLREGAERAAAAIDSGGAGRLLAAARRFR